MLTLELSSYLLEIANGAFRPTTRVLQADLLIWENNEKATLYINMPC